MADKDYKHPVLTWEGEQDYQPQFQHPITQPPNHNRPDNYEAQVTPPAQRVSGQGFGLQQAPQPAATQVPDFTPEEI